jgi:hypothetical protein
VDRDWVLQQLQDFVAKIDEFRPIWAVPDSYRTTQYQQLDDELAYREPVIRQIANAVCPGSGDYARDLDMYSFRWSNPRILAMDLIGRVEQAQEIEARLSAPGPQLQASNLHPDVWDAAQSLWRSQHRREAVEAAARSLNAVLQNKLDRREITNADLARQAFTPEAAEAGKPRLRFPGDRTSPTWRSRQQGTMEYAVGCFMAIRNVAAHEEDELSEHEALEQLAALSLLARWIDECELEDATRIAGGEAKSSRS